MANNYLEKRKLNSFPFDLKIIVRNETHKNHKN